MDCLCKNCKHCLTQQDKNAHLDKYENRLEERWVQSRGQPNAASAYLLQNMQYLMSQFQTLASEEQEAQLPWAFHLLSNFLHNQGISQIGEEGFEFLQKMCKPILDTAASAFESRHTNPRWWNRVIDLFCGLSKILSPIQLRVFFDTERLEWLVAGLGDLSAAAATPAEPGLNFTVTWILNTLGSAVGFNPKIAAQLRLLGIGKALSALIPKVQQNLQLSEHAACLVCRYMRGLYLATAETDPEIAPAAICVLGFDPKTHWLAISDILFVLGELRASTHEDQNLTNEFIKSLTDLFTKITDLLSIKWKKPFAEDLQNFTAGVLSLAESCTVKNPLLWTLLEHPNWGIMSATLLQQLENGSTSEIKQQIGYNIGRLWLLINHSTIVRHISKKLSPDTVQLVLHLSNTNGTEHYAHHFLWGYFAQAPLEHLQNLLQTNQLNIADRSNPSDKAKSELSHKNIKKLTEAIKMRKLGNSAQLFAAKIKSSTCPYHN